MPFLTQGKTNWKFLLIVVILATIVGGGALRYQYLEKEIKLPELKISERVIETPLEKLNDGENKIGSVIIKKIEPKQVEPSSVFIEEPLGLTNEGYFSAALNFNYKNNLYIIKSIRNVGSGGEFYMNYLYLLTDTKLQPVEFEDSPSSNDWFRVGGIEVTGPGYLLMDYNNYLYIISWSVGRGGYRNFYGLTEIHVLNENGKVTDNKYFDKSEAVPEGLSFTYPKAASLIEKDKELYLKINNTEDKIDKYYFLNNGKLIESSF